MKELKVTILTAYSWESQAVQYPPKGKAGIDYFKGVVDSRVYVDCLLYRNEEGDLIGILNHYPMDVPPFEIKGNFGIWIKPENQRQGIATKLLQEALNRYDDITIEQQKYTPEGLKFITNFLKTAK